MGNSHVGVAIVTAVLVGGGVWLGATVFGTEPEQPAASPGLTREVTEPPEEDPQPGLGRETSADSAVIDGLRRRVAELEKEVTLLRGALALSKEQMAPLVELYEKFKDAGGVHPLPVPGEGEPDLPVGGTAFVGEPIGGAPLARYLAKKAGLEPERAAELAKEYGAIEKEIEALEKRNAEVTRKDDTTTIKIGRYTGDGDQLRRRWGDWLNRNLSDDEREKFRLQGGTNKLMGKRLGDFAREITIKEAGGSIEISEEGDNGKGAKTAHKMQGPAIAREHVLEGYLHLMK